MESALDMVFLLRKRGVRIWSDNGQLRYQAAKGVLSSDEMRRLRERREEILSILQAPSAGATIAVALGPRVPGETIPLTFSQQWHWQRFDLGNRHGMRMLASAVRLAGALNISRLQASLSKIIRRHEALRTRIVCVEGVPTQCIGSWDDLPLDLVDLTNLSARDRECEARRVIQEFISRPIALAKDSMFGAMLVKCGDHDHVLVLAMEHLISDAVSMGIIWRELSRIYAQFGGAEGESLETIPVQFADYAVWQHKTEEVWTARHGSYWKGRLLDASRVRLSVGAETTRDGFVRWQSLQLQLGIDARSRLYKLSRHERSTLVMAVLSVYAAVSMLWCGNNDVVVPFITMGRLYPELRNTVGFFGTPLLLRAQLSPQDTFVDLLGKVSKEYANSYEHDDSGRIAAQSPDSGFLWNPMFNWVPQELNMNPSRDRNGSEFGRDIKVESFPLETVTREENEWDQELGIQFSDAKNDITGTIWYRTDRFRPSTVAQFAENLMFFADRVVEEPNTRVVAWRARLPHLAPAGSLG